LKGHGGAGAEQRTARVVKTLLLPHRELFSITHYIHPLASQRPNHHGCVKWNSPVMNDRMADPRRFQAAIVWQLFGSLANTV
jgi:hypothetical protein